MPLGNTFVRTVFIVSAFAVSGLALAQTTGKPAPAEIRQNLFVITDQEGYGTGECLEKQGGCGKIIADSFCESKGFRAAEYYRKTEPEEVTGSVASVRRPPPRDPQAFVIGCK
jgi:hypothetical protein